MKTESNRCFLSPLGLLGQSTPQTEWLINNRILYYCTVMMAGSPRSRCRHSQVRVLFQPPDCSLYPHITEGTRGLYVLSFIKVLISFRRAPLSWHDRLPKQTPLNTITLCVRLSTQEFLMGHRQSDCIWCLSPKWSAWGRAWPEVTIMDFMKINICPPTRGQIRVLQGFAKLTQFEDLLKKKNKI